MHPQCTTSDNALLTEFADPFTKVCCRCKQEKPIVAFYKHGRSKDGYNRACKECVNARNKENSHRWKQPDPNKMSSVGIARLAAGGRVCSRCHQFKTSEFFSPDKKSGLYSQCKECKSAARRARYVANPEKDKHRAYQWQQKNRSHWLQYRRQLYHKNKDRILTRRREHYATDPAQREKAHQYNAIYREQHRERICAYLRNWWANHREEQKVYRRQYYLQHRGPVRKPKTQEERLNAVRLSRQKWLDKHYWDERYRQARCDSARKYRQTHPEHRVAHRHKRRALLTSASGSYTATEWKALCRWFKHHCLCCGTKTKLTPDHVIPLSKGGANGIENIQPLCLPCNVRKHTKTTDYRDPRRFQEFLCTLRQPQLFALEPFTVGT